MRRSGVLEFEAARNSSRVALGLGTVGNMVPAKALLGTYRGSPTAIAIAMRAVRPPAASVDVDAHIYILHCHSVPMSIREWPALA